MGQHCSNVDLSDWPEKDTPQIWKVSGVALVGLWVVTAGVGNPVMCVTQFSISDVPQQCAGILHCDDRRE